MPSSTAPHQGTIRVLDLVLSTEEAADVLSALRSGRVDGLVVQGAAGARVYTLRDLDDAYRVLFDTLNEGVIFLDASDCVTHTNQRALELLGAGDAADLIQRSFASFVPRELEATAREMLGAAKRGQVQGELTLLGQCGRPVPVLASCRCAVLPGEGAAVATAVVLTDLSEVRAAHETQERLEAELFQASKELTIARLTSSIAHDFGNVLTVVLQGLEAVLEQPDLPEQVRTDVQEVQFAARRGAAITRQLMTFVRRHAAREERPSVDVNAVVDELASILSRLDNRTVELRLDLDPATPRAAISRVQLEQVLLNLVRNGQQATPAGGSVTITTRAPTNFDPVAPQKPTQGMVHLTVADTGSGMSAEAQQHLFERFFTTKPKGTGLGLTTVRELVERAGGAIAVTTVEGRGTQVEVRLPVRTEPLSSYPPAAEPQASRAQVLLVEDDVGVRQFIARSLEKRGYLVSQAGSAEEAMDTLLCARYLETGPVDVIVSDVGLPAASGVDLMREVRANPHLRSVPVLLISGALAHPTELGVEIDAITDFLNKPFPSEVLAERLASILKRARAGSAAAEA